MTAPYLPWWLGASSLALVTVGSCIVARRPLGVSGVVARFVNLREEIEVERARATAADDAEALDAAMLAATAELLAATPDARALALEIDGGAVPPAAIPPQPASALQPAGARRGCADCGAMASRPTLAAHAVFLVAIVVGGFLARVSRGAWRPHLDMGATFATLTGGGWRAAAALLGGGVLIGVGTTVSGGCSTGHGLSGCSRLQPAGVAATGAFFATAVAVSLLLARGAA